MLSQNDVVLFQGDSITDCGRSREKTTGHLGDALGRGYAMMAASRLLADRPAMGLTFLNRGVSGNKVTQLAERWQADCLDLRPNVVSILIGVNDTWHGQNEPGKGVPLDVYERTYDELLARTKRELPGVKLVLCEPFVLRCGAVTDRWFPEIDQRRQIVAKLAEAHGARLVAFQAALDDAMKRHPRPEHWLGDGVHPSLAGHCVLAAAWVEAVV